MVGQTAGSGICKIPKWAGCKQMAGKRHIDTVNRHKEHLLLKRERDRDRDRETERKKHVCTRQKGTAREGIQDGEERSEVAESGCGLSLKVTRDQKNNIPRFCLQ